MITVVIKNNRDPDIQYIGRGSPLGNPFKMQNQSEAERNRVCDLYHDWFYERVQSGDPKIITELRRLFKIARDGNLNLGCFCAPRRCHGDTIKQFLDNQLNIWKQTRSERKNVV